MAYSSSCSVELLRDAVETLSITKLPDNINSCRTVDELIQLMHNASVKFVNERTERALRRSKVATPHYISELNDIPDRNIDMEYIEELNSMAFVKEHRNLIIWGAPGTGKTWIGKMFITTACSNGLRAKWVSFPDLYDQLERLQQDNTAQSLESKLQYYSRFDLLGIDEFPNISNMDEMLVQRIFNALCEKDTSILICTQCQQERIDALFTVQGIGQSVRGRLLNGAKRLHMSGSDLRMRSCKE